MGAFRPWRGPTDAGWSRRVPSVLGTVGSLVQLLHAGMPHAAVLVLSAAAPLKSTLASVNVPCRRVLSPTSLAGSHLLCSTTTAVLCSKDGQQVADKLEEEVWVTVGGMVSLVARPCFTSSSGTLKAQTWTSLPVTFPVIGPSIRNFAPCCSVCAVDITPQACC
jgi:hypothetical protein